ncbi:hypothetical protein CVT26_002747 [Gymnopilus dilepis]|uniref:Uncharacterized protein n=1 Tax=Gymnopilus dilepis TaxID=231916 RepID=A0A409VEY3_9AGAR|nr:hypothetical protein CVT26_002747 [Gymnopilus dilepis]
MSEWFRSIPMALDSVAFAAKFQQDAMASQIRYHKARHQQLRQLVERLKRDLSDMKRSYDILQNENEQYKLRFGSLHLGQEPSDLPNMNGKRQMMNTAQFEQANRRSRTDSSPRSINTPIGPDRLTLLPGQKHPELSSRKEYDNAEQQHFLGRNSDTANRFSNDGILQHRPVSNRSLERDQAQRPLSKRSLDDFFQEERQMQPNNMQPPPTSSRFKPAPPSGSYPAGSKSTANRRQTNMGPPPTPQHVRNKDSASINMTSKASASVPNQASGNHSSTSANQIASQNQQQQQQHTNAVGRRFFPQAPNAQSTLGPGLSRGNSRAQGSVPPMTPGQRTPFLPISSQRGRFG